MQKLNLRLAKLISQSQNQQRQMFKSQDLVAILIQKSEAGVGGSFGGSDNFNAGFQTRRGFEKKLFYFTIAIAILFVVSSSFKISNSFKYS
jgi:hypothetical protein